MVASSFILSTVFASFAASQVVVEAGHRYTLAGGPPPPPLLGLGGVNGLPLQNEILPGGALVVRQLPANAQAAAAAPAVPVVPVTPTAPAVPATNTLQNNNQIKQANTLVGRQILANGPPPPLLIPAVNGLPPLNNQILPGAPVILRRQDLVNGQSAPLLSGAKDIVPTAAVPVTNGIPADDEILPEGAMVVKRATHNTTSEHTVCLLSLTLQARYAD